MIPQFAYTSQVFFFFSNLPCKRQIETCHVYMYLYHFSNCSSCYSWARMPGVGGWAATAESRKETVQYLLLFCYHEQVIESLRGKVPYNCLSTNQVSSPTDLILQGWEIFTEWEGSSPSWLDDTMHVLLWSFGRIVPRRGWKSTAGPGEVYDLKVPERSLWVWKDREWKCFPSTCPWLL